MAIAQAAISPAPVLILDEAPCSIDTDGKADRGRVWTLWTAHGVVIAHRLSTVRNSKAIMVLEKGSIIERGSHEELLEQQGQYYKLYTGRLSWNKGRIVVL